ncbi:MAG TPA: hypothetical protein VFG00_12770, partial [Acidothermaceae bacterium]|nr:hypothetical protein [Acidothermaceae bacterium]
VPLGAEDELVCPESHIKCLWEHMTYAFDGLNVLVIGYSGIDNEVLNLIAQSGRRVKAIKVVNGSSELGLSAAEVFGKRLGFAVDSDKVFPGGFTDFAQSSAMADYLNAL